MDSLKMSLLDVPCLQVFDPKYNDGVYPKFIHPGIYGAPPSGRINNDEELARAWCHKGMSLDVLKKKDRRLLLQSLSETSPELADALSRAEKQFDFVRAMLKHFNQENEPENQINLRSGLEYALNRNPLDGKNVFSVCMACRQTIEVLLKAGIKDLK